jgi:EAL domain-containing protein (putative c-di-GMP-specific phosphodiesterase class I)
VTGYGDTIVLVDDEPVLLRTLARLLRDCAATIECFSSAAEAVERVQRGGVEVVISDVSMPGMNGIELLRRIREYDADLPVVLITGDPAGAGSARAGECGAFKEVLKPVDNQELRATVQRAAKLHRLIQTRRQALGFPAAGGSIFEQERLDANLERAFEDLWMAFQPIVRVSDQSVLGYEALLRSNEPSLPTPVHVLQAAERTGQIVRLGRAVRSRVAAVASDHRVPKLFLNLHPQELADPELLNRASPLAANAARIVLEISERASLEEAGNPRKTLARLRECGYRIAIDDVGAEHAGLTSFALLEPEFVKLDMTLVRDIEQSSAKQTLVGSIATLCKDLGLSLIAEGVETAAERDTLIELGCDLLQGYLFARPGRALVEPSWDELRFGAVRSDFPLSGTHLIPKESQPVPSLARGDERPKRLRMG